MTIGPGPTQCKEASRFSLVLFSYSSIHRILVPGGCKAANIIDDRTAVKVLGDRKAVNK
jgi:hypothetical protein